MASKKRDDIMVDIYQKAEISIEELRSKVNDLAALKDLFKDLSDKETSSLVEKFKGSNIGDILKESSNVSGKIQDMHSALDQLKKVSKDIEATQKGTNASYEETLKLLKDIYTTKKRSNDLNEESLKVIQGQINALSLHEAQYRKLHQQKQRQFEEEKNWTNQLAQLVDRKFGKDFGSSTIGAALGKPQGSMMSAIVAHLGQTSGFADKFSDNTFVKLLAKGFDVADTSSKIAKNTASTATEIKKQTDPQTSATARIASGVALTAIGAVAGVRYAGGKGIEAAGWGIDKIRSFSDPAGLNKLLYGETSGKIAGAIFGGIAGKIVGEKAGKIVGEKAGKTVTGIAGILLDALSHGHKMKLDSAIASAGLRAQSGNQNAYLSLIDVAGATGLSSSAATSVLNQYTRMGVNFDRGGGVYENIRRYGHAERFMGADVMQTGFGAAYRGLDDSNQAALKLYRTFTDVRGSANSIGYSVQEMTKQISTAAASARFLQWDFSVISKLATGILGGGGDTEMLKLGLDPKQNMAGILGGLTGIRKSSLATELFHSRNMGFVDTQAAIRGAAFGVGPQDVGNIYYDKAGFAVNKMTLNQQLEGGARYNLGLLQSAQQTLLGLDEGTKDYIQRDDAFARQMGLGSAETAKILLNSVTGRSLENMSEKEVERLVGTIQEGGKTETDLLRDIKKYSEDSSAFTEKFQNSATQLLVSILNALVLLPGYLGAIFSGNFKDIGAYDDAYSKIGARATKAFNSIYKGSKSMEGGLIFPELSNVSSSKAINDIVEDALPTGTKAITVRQRAMGTGRTLTIRERAMLEMINRQQQSQTDATQPISSDADDPNIKDVGGFNSFYKGVQDHAKKGAVKSHQAIANRSGNSYNFFISNSLVDLAKIKSLLSSMVAEDIV